MSKFSNEARTYIQDSFTFLVAQGMIHIMFDHGWASAPRWIVSLNGRRYTETEPNHPALFVFKCQTEYGLVEVSFPRKDF